MVQRWIMHIDMDAFFASIEQLDNPQLQGKPVVVGSGTRSVVCAASYEVRRFGVHSAMPIATARKLCPHAVFVPVRHQRYREVSRQIMGILERFSPTVEQASIDEAYLDATGLERLFGPLERMAQAIKKSVHKESGGLTCSVGLAPIKFLAKIASDINKPDGLYILSPAAMPDFLARLPVERIPGVGAHFRKKLMELGVKTGQDVLRYPQEFWERHLGKAGLMLHQRAQGIDERSVEPRGPQKSDSAECTFEQDSHDPTFLKNQLFVLVERVGASLRSKKLAGRTITLKIKYADFQQHTRSHTLPQRTAATETIFQEACALLDSLKLERRVRLIGVAVSNFEERSAQLLLPLAEDTSHKDEKRRMKLDMTLDTLHARFGNRAVMRGRLFSALESHKASYPEEDSE